MVITVALLLLAGLEALLELLADAAAAAARGLTPPAPWRPFWRDPS